MPFTLNHVVPWGRSFDEYRRMFALTEDDLRRKIVACADGPAAFNVEATRQGLRVVSCDPLYQFHTSQIEKRIEETYDQVMEETRQNRRQFTWREFKSVNDLGHKRLAAMRAFLKDFERGKSDGRYIVAELPSLPFSDLSFDLGLCSHFLFLYTEQLSEAFHIQAIEEMCRVAPEARIFPLLTMGGTKSPLVDPVVGGLCQAGFEVSVEAVPYEFVRRGNEMMRIRKGPSNTQ